MTELFEHFETAKDHLPVNVKVTNPEAIGADIVSPPYGSFDSFRFTGTEDVVQILPQNPLRAKAWVYVLPGFTNNNQTGYVLIGTREQCQNGQGGVFVAGSVIEWVASRALYCIPDGTDSLTVTVQDQLYMATETTSGTQD